MKKSPNLNTCTAEEFADWLQHVKEEQGVVMHHTGFYTYDQLYTLAEAFRIFGQREGYKKGKRDGSYAGYKVGFQRGYDEAELLFNDDDDWCEEEWYK